VGWLGCFRPKRIACKGVGLEAYGHGGFGTEIGERFLCEEERGCFGGEELV
jgi:hypothetical protein